MRAARRGAPGLQVTSTVNAPRRRASAEPPARTASRRSPRCRPPRRRAARGVASRAPPARASSSAPSTDRKTAPRPPAITAWTWRGDVLKVGGHSAASITPSRPLVPAPTKMSRPPPASRSTMARDHGPDGGSGAAHRAERGPIGAIHEPRDRRRERGDRGRGSADWRARWAAGRSESSPWRQSLPYYKDPWPRSSRVSTCSCHAFPPSFVGSPSAFSVTRPRSRAT